MPARNVIILHTDQQRFDSLGCNGNRFARTPSIDRLAAGGTVFTRHIASNPICSPSRASLLTGLYPPGHNVWCNGIALNRREYAGELDNRYERLGPDGQGGFHPEPPTMADMFAQAGYDTASFGKLHLTPYMARPSFGYPETIDRWADGSMEEWHGPYYGFRYVDMTLGHGDQPAWPNLGHYAGWLQREHPEACRRVQEGVKERPAPAVGDLYPFPLPYELHHSAWLAERLCAYLTHERPADTPFFAFVGFPDPHHPFTPCPDIVRDFEDIDVPAPTDPDGRGLAGSPAALLNQHHATELSGADFRTVIRYTYAMIHQIDLAVGRILDTLGATGLLDETIIVFTSDHGDYLGDHGYLRKGFCASHALVHVPFVLRAPGSGLPAQVDAPMSNCDVMPTLAALTGVQPPAWQHGTDITRVVREGRDHEALVFSGNGDPAGVNYTLYDADYRLTWYPGADFTELFDHRADPAECANLAGLPEHRARIVAMKGRIAEQLATCYSPIQGRIAAW